MPKFDYKQEITDLVKRNPYLGADHWFEFIGNDKFNVYDREMKAHVGIYDMNSDLGQYRTDVNEHIVKMNLDNWLNNRPEGKCVSFSGNTVEQQFVWLWAGMFFMRAFHAIGNPDDALDKVLSSLNWIYENEFFETPASSKYHESCRGGLMYHVCKVAYCMKHLFNSDLFPCVKYDSAILVALCHDFNKLYKYEQYEKNVRDEYGNWSQETAYTVSRNQKFIYGGAVSSMMIASKFFKLSEDEALAIRWHHGAWDVNAHEVSELQLANEMYPLVHMLQFADQLAITKYII